MVKLLSNPSESKSLSSQPPPYTDALDPNPPEDWPDFSRPSAAPPNSKRYLGKNGWTFTHAADGVVMERSQPGGWLERKHISRTVWDSATNAHPWIAPSPERPEGPEESRSLDIVQRINERTPWQVQRDAIDNAVIAKIANHLRQTGHAEKADRMQLCGVVRGRRECLDCGEKQSPEIIQCGEYRLCPRCARIHAQKLRRELEEGVKAVPKVRGCRWSMLTVTVKTDGEVKEAHQTLNKSFGGLHREVLTYGWRRLDAGADVRQRGGRSYCGKRRVFEGKDGQFWERLPTSGTAAARFNENGEDTGNVHAHCLLYAQYIPQAVISREWERLTGSKVVDIRAIRPKGDDAVTMAGAIVECCKYVTKIGSLPAAEVVALWKATKGRQLSQRYGELRKTTRSETQLEAVPCPVCGSVRYRWLYVPLVRAIEEHLRGPPD